MQGRAGILIFLEEVDYYGSENILFDELCFSVGCGW